MEIVGVRTVGVGILVTCLGCTPHDNPAERAAASRSLPEEPYPGPKTLGPCDPLEVLPQYAGRRRIQIEFLAEDARGNIVMATHPRPPDDVLASSAYRVFFGPPDAVEERILGSFGADEEGPFFQFFLEEGRGESVRVSRDECSDIAACSGVLKSERGISRLTPLDSGVSGLKFLCRAWWKER